MASTDHCEGMDAEETTNSWLLVRYTRRRRAGTLPDGLRGPKSGSTSVHCPRIPEDRARPVTRCARQVSTQDAVGLGTGRSRCRDRTRSVSGSDAVDVGGGRGRSRDGTQSTSGCDAVGVGIGRGGGREATRSVARQDASGARASASGAGRGRGRTRERPRQIAGRTQSIPLRARPMLRGATSFRALGAPGEKIDRRDPENDLERPPLG